MIAEGPCDAADLEMMGTPLPVEPETPVRYEVTVALRLAAREREGVLVKEAEVKAYEAAKLEYEEVKKRVRKGGCVAEGRVYV